jgi:tRNA(Arg) A34 adenosine deaminase TadA
VDESLDAAVAKAQDGGSEGGIPVGAMLVHEGRIIGRAIGSGRASSGRFLWHQLDLQLATDRARVPLERRQRRRMLARRFQA